MRASKVTFHRLHKFVEGSVAFTPAQVAAATYKVVVSADKGATNTFTLPNVVLAGVGPNVPVVAPFQAFGFQPIAGVTYHLSVVCDIDGVESPASPPITFTNALTPAAVDTVSVS